jgi:Protein of unknown function (DUF3035)
MRIAPVLLAASAAALLVGCVGGGPFNRTRPDEFAVARGQPLVVPPDFAMTPPRPGEADAAANDPRAQALQALFGGPAPRSAVENNLLQVAHADRAAMGARSVAGDPRTTVVSRGTLVQTMLQLPPGDGQEASVSVPN